MTEWTNNTNENGIPIIIKVLHIGDFIELIYEDSKEKLHGGFVTTLTSDSPQTDKGNNKIYLLGLSTSHPHNHEDETILWVSRIKSFRIVHK